MNDFSKEYKILESNKDLQKEVMLKLMSYGIDCSKKGSQYLIDMITLILLLKDYSRIFNKETYEFIAHKYGIKPHSVQRQLRYVCTIKTDGAYKPIELVEKIYYTLKQKMIEKEIAESENKKIKN